MKSPFFCPECKKVMRPFDSDMYKKIGICCDCEADLESHLKAINNAEKLKLLEFLKVTEYDLYFDDGDGNIANLVKLMMDDGSEINLSEVDEFIKAMGE